MFARTRRLMLRPGWPEDAPALSYALSHAISQPDVAGTLAHGPWSGAIDDAERFLAMPCPPAGVRLLMFESPAHTPRLVGGLGIAAGDEAGRSELGYWLVPDARGRGYATEASRQVIEIARHALGLKRLHAHHFADDAASRQVLRTLGFVATGEVALRPSRARGAKEPAALFVLDLHAEPAMPLAA